jgi:phi LC3 family holin
MVVIRMEERCVVCGEIIPEGRQVCPSCSIENGVSAQQYRLVTIQTGKEKGALNMKINWIVRIKNQQFWISVIPAIALVVQAVAAVFGYTLDFRTLVGKLLAVVDAVFALLVILGIVVDPTTKGLGDSNRAMSYDEPWVDEIE